MTYINAVEINVLASDVFHIFLIFSNERPSPIVKSKKSIPISENNPTASRSVINLSPEGPSKIPAIMYPRTGECPIDEKDKPDPIAHKTTEAIFIIVQFMSGIPKK
jgi:hypothetical protein